MALTSPDDIWTPDSGDDYALTTDLATMADTIQSALTKKANYGVGTTAEMNAALSRFPNGALWYNTTTSSEWRRVSGAWVNQDTGWVSLVAQNSWSAINDSMKARRLNGVVHLRGVASKSAPADGYEIAFSLPSGIPAPTTDTGLAVSFGSSSSDRSAYVDSSGALQVYKKGTSSGAFVRIGGSWPVG